jgi:outer membrane protein OmpA-like peptidoglycan-associated protein
LLAALLLAATGCEQIPPRPPPQHEAKPELPPWYPEPPWNGKERPKRVFFTGKVLFDTNKSVIRADAEPVLQKVLAYLKENEDISRVRIEGHCDHRASEEYNQKLSERRAIAVSDWLVDHGLDHNRLLAVGFGELRPIAPNDTAAGMQENRRGAFHVAEVGGFPHRGEDPTNGGLVLVILSKEEREALAKKGEVPKPPPPPPFHPEGPIFKPEEPPKAPQSESTAPQADPGAGES